MRESENPSEICPKSVKMPFCHSLCGGACVWVPVCVCLSCRLVVQQQNFVCSSTNWTAKHW